MQTTQANVIRKLNRESRRSFEQAAIALPENVTHAIRARAVEAVNSGEPHKVTGGWVILPFMRKYPVMGLLEVATRAIKHAQLAAM